MTKTRLVPGSTSTKTASQTGFVRLFHSTHNSAYGFIPIPITVVKNGDGPTALFSAPNLSAGSRDRSPPTTSSPRYSPEMVRGRVILLPMANFPAAIAGAASRRSTAST